jgi:ABC-type transport system substrate-binding protein
MRFAVAETPIDAKIPSCSSIWIFLLIMAALSGCDGEPWNSPYPKNQSRQNIYYSTFSERPKHLDPARSYSSNETVFTCQIYEPPLQYHFLNRPYELIPLTVTDVPIPVYLDAQGNELAEDASVVDIEFSVYTIEIQPGIQYQPHPAFAMDERGKPLYLNLTSKDIESVFTLNDFTHNGTRELVAADYVYEIKRLASPHVQSPIFGLMSDYIVGLGDYGKQLQSVNSQLVKEQGENAFLDLTQYDFDGVKVLGRYQYQIRIHGKYPQFIYWLAMPFFAPLPPEVDQFYSQAGMNQKNITLDWYPVGTGPFMLSENNPNMRMVMTKNPNFHGELYPNNGEVSDQTAGFLVDAGKPLPFIDKAIFSLEKEDIPAWNKFLQGYYDASGINSDSFDQAISFNAQGEAGLSDSMKTKGIKLITGVGTSTYFMGFNMLDAVVGGMTDDRRKLRQAISIAIDYEEFISIFVNGRGITAQGPIPPGIFGYKSGEEGINSYVFDWVNGRAQRKSIDYAKQLLAQAGYPDGRDAETGKPLTIFFDTTATGPDDKARMDWFRKQFQKLNIQLVVRGTDYNRFQDKMRNGTVQFFQWGWNADYPDPENFLFLLYGPNIKKDKNGENDANYQNAKFDRLFETMKNMANGPQRQKIIDDMVEIVRNDSPWVWGLHPMQFSLYHSWYDNAKPNLMANNTLKYKRIAPQLRAKKRREWNQPVVWPIVLTIAVLVIVVIPAAFSYRAKIHSRGVRSW